MTELTPTMTSGNMTSDNNGNTTPSIFTFPTTGQTVRIVMRNGEPWFVARDVCKCLDIKNGRDAVTTLDEDEKGVVITDTLGGQQELSIISEPGLYSLILRSRKTEAKAFKRWVTHDVLPSIRRSGGYIHVNPEEDTPEIIMAKALRVADETIRRQKAQLEAVRPTLDKYSTFLDTRGALTLTEVAKQFNLTPKLLGRMLRSKDIHWLYWNRKHINIPTKTAIDNGYVIVISCRNRQTDELTTQARITPHGMNALYALLKPRITAMQQSRA